MVVQWLRLRAPNAEGMSSIPSQGTQIPHMPCFAVKKTQTNKISLKILFLPKASFPYLIFPSGYIVNIGVKHFSRNSFLFLILLTF